MYDEDDLIPISALQHFAFCERQWALIHLECAWEENVLTMEGRILHEHSDEYGSESRKDLKIVRSLRLRSLRLGLSGKADIVEFHKISPSEIGVKAQGNESPVGTRIPGASGLWRPHPVEYKRGSPKIGRWDEIQLCAQALCLEEMLTTVVPDGSLYYGTPKRRTPVLFDEPLRNETERLAEIVHERTRSGTTPHAKYDRRCERCSMYDMCLPKVTHFGRSVKEYLSETYDPPNTKGE